MAKSEKDASSGGAGKGGTSIEKMTEGFILSSADNNDTTSATIETPYRSVTSSPEEGDVSTNKTKAISSKIVAESSELGATDEDSETLTKGKSKNVL